MTYGGSVATRALRSKAVMALVVVPILAAACSAPPPGATASESAGGEAATPSVPAGSGKDVLRVAPGEMVQVGQHSEVLLHAVDQAFQFAQTHADDTGYPWVDPTSEELILSAATAQGRTLLEAEGAELGVPYRIRDVAHSVGELRQIQDDVTHLLAQGVPDAQLIYATLPDERDNLVLVTMSADSTALVDALARRFGAHAIAVQVDPTRGPAGTTG